MKTDYPSLGRAALETLTRTTEQACRVQREQLESILRRNAHTRYGARYSFSGIRSVQTFQQQVPLSRYEDYEPYIQRLLAGQKAQLTQEEPVYYAITSGSTGTPKYVPVTREDMEVHYRSIYGGVFGMVQRHFPQVPSSQLFGKIWETGEFADTRLPGGQLCGIRSASLYQWLDRDGGFDAGDYCVPKEVLFPDTLEDLTYLKARFALAEPGITAIHSVFLHRVVRQLDYIREHWDLLLRDMAQGTVDPGVPLTDRWRQRLARWLPADPRRAAQLRALGIEKDGANMARKIWPGLRYILGIGGEHFPQYTQAVRRYAGDVPIHHFIYGASEGFLSIAAGVDVPDAYILLPEAGFFEFLPVEDGQTEETPRTMGEVERGKRYELVFTNHSGLYRYRMQDVLEVVDFYGQAPVVRFCYRIHQVLNVADEKLNTEQLQAAFDAFTRQTGLEGATFCVQEDFSTHPGRYLFYLEAAPYPDAARVLDGCLCRASLGYRGCREMGDIAPAAVRFVPPGSFAQYEAALAGQGRRMAQYKPVRVLHNAWSRNFFAAQADRMKGMKTG